MGLITFFFVVQTKGVKIVYNGVCVNTLVMLMDLRLGPLQLDLSYLAQDGSSISDLLYVIYNMLKGHFRSRKIDFYESRLR